MPLNYRMRIYKYLFFLGLLAFAGCLSEGKRPDNVLSEERMPAVLADIHIVDGDLYNVPQDKDSLFKYSAGHYQAIFKKYHTDSTQFRKSYAWYTQHPVKLDVIYDKVVAILQTKNDSISKIKTPAAKLVPATPAPAPQTPNQTPPVKVNVVPAQ
jgi:hypothetical protein